jgi:hypothetical protein
VFIGRQCHRLKFSDRKDAETEFLESLLGPNWNQTFVATFIYLGCDLSTISSKSTGSLGSTLHHFVCAREHTMDIDGV